MEQNDHMSLVQIHNSVALRLKEFSSVTGHNPNHMADMILTQWMDNQLEMYGEKWNIHGDKAQIMQG